MEVTFKYSMISTDLRPPKRLLEEEPSGLAPAVTQDANPRPLKRMKSDVEHEAEIEEEQASYAELEANMKGLIELTASCEDIKARAAAMEHLLASKTLQDCLPLVTLIKKQLDELNNRIRERNSFFALWVVR